MSRRDAVSGLCPIFCPETPDRGPEAGIGDFGKKVFVPCPAIPYTKGNTKEENEPMRNQTKASVLVVEAEPIMRGGLVQLINSHATLEVCGEADSLPAARAACERWRPAVVVLDVTLGGGEGYALVRELPRWNANVAVVAFARLEDTASIQRALRAGVCGYVTRLDPAAALLTAITEALAGKRLLGPRAALALLETMATGRVQMADDDMTRLSEREQQVFRLIGGGMKTCAVAVELRLSVKTVETHRQHIKEKLGLTDGAALQRRAALFEARQEAAHHSLGPAVPAA